MLCDAFCSHTALPRVKACTSPATALYFPSKRTTTAAAASGKQQKQPPSRYRWSLIPTILLLSSTVGVVFLAMTLSCDNPVSACVANVYALVFFPVCAAPRRHVLHAPLLLWRLGPRARLRLSSYSSSRLISSTPRVMLASSPRASAASRWADPHRSFRRSSWSRRSTSRASWARGTSSR